MEKIMEILKIGNSFQVLLAVSRGKSLRKGRIIQTLTVLSASSRRRARRSCSLARSLEDGTADRQPDPPSSLEHLSCTSPSFPLWFSSSGGVRQRHASCRDSVISNTAGDASAAAATALPPSSLQDERATGKNHPTHAALHRVKPGSHGAERRRRVRWSASRRECRFLI